jgi:hypothetical protein
MESQRGSTIFSAIAALTLLLLVLFAGFVFWRGSGVRLTTPYHAVLLDSGQVYFGKLESLGTPWSPYCVLTDVFYVQTLTNPETKQASNILVKRGKEWHAPDRMIVNDRHVVLVEPVAEGSKVAELIAESKK